MSRKYTITDPSIWKKRWGKARDAAFKMYDNNWTAAQASEATGLSVYSIRMAAYRQHIPIKGVPGRPPYGAVKQAVFEALVGRETMKQLMARTGFKKSSIRSACKNIGIVLLKDEQATKA
jgi:hypothetical protein